MTDNILTVQTRTEFGKGPARRDRRAGLVPAVLYGHIGDNVHLNVPQHELYLIIRHTSNAVVDLVNEGDHQLALVKDVQIHPVSRALLHVDFLAVREGEKVEVSVPIVVVGEPVPGTQHNVDDYTILVQAPATAIPEDIRIDITGLEAGTVVRVSDLEIPEGVEVQLDADQDILSVQEIQDIIEEEPTETATLAAEEPADEEPADED